MAYNIKNFCRAKGKYFIKTWVHRRLLTSIPQPTLHINRPSLEKKTKSSFIQWNSVLTLSNRTSQYFSHVLFHDLAEHALISHGVYITNIGIRKFAGAPKEELPLPKVETPNIKEVHDNVRLEKEKQRLKQKGVMKDITVKIPEGVMYSKL